MRITRSGLVITVMGVVIALLAWALVYFARDELDLVAAHEEEEIPTASAVSSKAGHAVIALSAESQKASGILTAALGAADNQATVEVFGAVLDPQPLFELRAQYLAALAEARALRVAVSGSEAEYQRARRLFADDRNVSERALQAAQTQWRADQARLSAAEQTAGALRENLRANWGDAIAGWAGDPAARFFHSLSARREALVRVSLPFELRERAAQAALRLSPTGMGAAVRPARYVAPAQHSDAGATGSTFLYLADAIDLRQGMRVTGRLAVEGAAREGVVVPSAAVVWHGGQAWCYVQEEPDEFVRRKVDTREELGEGWFNASGFEAGEKVVVRGAQLLLSEEQKFLIREENDD